MIKKLRTAVQFLFFLTAVYVFSGLFINQLFINIFHSLHIFPSISNIAWLTLPSFFWITLIIIFFPILFGRIYCSFVCPVGFLQDSVTKIFSLFKRNKTTPWWFSYISTFFLFLSLALIIKRNSSFGYIDHYSNFGRLVYLAKGNIDLSTSVITFFFIFLITIPLLFYPRFFCFVICPSGALFHFFDKFSFLKIKGSDLKHCAKCKACETKCPTSCIKEGKIDKNFCITCFECVDACPHDSFKPYFSRKNRDEEKFSKKRRNLLVNSLSGTIAVIAGIKIFNSGLLRKISNPYLVVPPGAKSAEKFFSKCTFCNLCVSACPTKVLVSSSPNEGSFVFPKPKMDFNKSYCSYECNECLKVCPSGAISYFKVAEKKQIKIGNAHIHRRRCIPFLEDKACAACAEHCPTGAIEMFEIRKNVFAPRVNEDFCIGCGACQFACPVLPNKAITITPEYVHSVAYSPLNKLNEYEENKNESNEFPF